MEKIRVLIPAYNPDERLIKLYNALNNVLDITIVDDGSENKEIFNFIPPSVVHSANLGKGEALKSGVNYIIKNFPDCKGIVTADCDLQHSPADIIKLARQLEKEPNKLYLGSRNFKAKNVPLRSFLGNTFMSKIIKVRHNINVKDTQTGLRGIPIDFAKHILKLTCSDFSFETKMLIEAKLCNLPIEEIPIETIYIDNNKHSHFKPLKDSIKIFQTVIRN